MNYKFRGKRVDTKEWVYGFVQLHLVDGDLTKTKQDAFITCDSMDEIGKVYRDTFEVLPETVGRCVELPDKNGVDIYEGDIAIIAAEGEDERFKIVWDKDTASFVIEADTFVVTFDNYNGYELEVIGNKHDNPELLEGE